MQEIAKLQKKVTKETVAAALYPAELTTQLANLALSLQQPCTTPEEQAVLASAIKQAKAAVKVATDLRLAQTRNIDALKAVFMDAEKDLLAEINQQLQAATAKETAFIREQARLAEEQRKNIEEEQLVIANRKRSVESKAAVELQTQARLATVAAPVGARKVWVHEVADITKVPVEYLQINDAAVKAAIAAGVRDIPGIVIKQDYTRTGR